MNFYLIISTTNYVKAHSILIDKSLTFAGSLTYKINDDHGFSYRRRLVEVLMDTCNLETYSELNNDNNNPREAIRQRICKIRYEIHQLLNSYRSL